MYYSCQPNRNLRERESMEKSGRKRKIERRRVGGTGKQGGQLDRAKEREGARQRGKGFILGGY